MLSNTTNDKSIIMLHAQGISNAEIMRQLSLKSDSSIKALGLKSQGLQPRPLKMIGDQHGWCWKCITVLPLDSFRLFRRRDGRTARASYCKLCMREKYYARRGQLEFFVKDIVWRCKSRAFKEGLSFDLDAEWVKEQLERQQRKCFYTDKDLRIAVKMGHGEDSLSVDKIVPEYGYIRTNVVFCTRKANRVKNNLTLVEMKEWLPGWYQRLVDKGLINNVSLNR